MDDLRSYIIGALITIIGAGVPVIVAYFNSLKDRIEKLSKEKDDYKGKDSEKEEHIRVLNNGFRDRVIDLNTRVSNIEKSQEVLKSDVKEIKEAILGGK